MADKYRIITTDGETDRRRYYVSRETGTGRITWTEEEIYATTFASRSGAENVLRILEDMCRAAHAYHVLIEVEKVESRKGSGKAAPEPTEEKPAELAKECVPSAEEWGSPRSTFSFGKLPPIHLFIRKTEAGEQEYRFTDENGTVRSTGTGAEAGKDVAKAFCVYAYKLMAKKISEAEAKRSGKPM